MNTRHLTWNATRLGEDHLDLHLPLMQKNFRGLYLGSFLISIREYYLLANSSSMAVVSDFGRSMG